ncbi:MAG: thiol-activated cytolysin family protein [Candidatus Krumholzibacteriia bacterium]
MRPRIMIPAILLGTAVLLAACSSEDPTGPAPIPDSEFDQILAAAGFVQPLGEEHDTVVETSEEEENGFRYTYEVHDALENLESVAYLGLNDDIVWPGNMVRGEHAHQFVYEPISAPRAPFTMSISLESSSIGGELSETVDTPSLSNVRQGISNLVARVFTENTHVPAQVDFDYQQVYSQSQMNLFVGVDVTYGAGSLESAFDWDQNTQTTKIMAKYQQIYYSIDLDTPASPRDLFADDITTAQLESAMPEGSCPLYVSSVKYGMMAIMCIETEFSEEQMDLALDAAYHGGVDVELSFGYTAYEVLDSSSIRIIVYGGSTEGIEELNGVESFMNIIGASTEFNETSPGVPILYKFRHVADNTLALITLTGQYTICRPLQIAQRVQVNLLRFVCEWSDDDEWFANSIVDIDRINLSMQAFNRVDDQDPGTLINEGNETLVAWSTSDYIEMPAGYIFEYPVTRTLTFDTENFDWTVARLYFWGSARDYDPAENDEWSSGSLELVGNQIFGEHNVIFYGQDFRMRAELMIEPLN